MAQVALHAPHATKEVMVDTVVGMAVIQVGKANVAHGMAHYCNGISKVKHGRNKN